MRKWVSLVLAVVMVFALCAGLLGCGNTTDYGARSPEHLVELLNDALARRDMEAVWRLHAASQMSEGIYVREEILDMVWGWNCVANLSTSEFVQTQGLSRAEYQELLEEIQFLEYEAHIIEIMSASGAQELSVIFLEVTLDNEESFARGRYLFRINNRWFMWFI